MINCGHIRTRGARQYTIKNFEITFELFIECLDFAIKSVVLFLRDTFKSLINISNTSNVATPK